MDACAQRVAESKITAVDPTGDVVATDVSFFEAFHLDVAAQTDEDTASYWQEANANWSVNFSGKINVARGVFSWEPQAGIKVLDKPSRWGPGELPIPLNVSPPPSLEAITADYANDLLDNRTWSTV